MTSHEYKDLTTGAINEVISTMGGEEGAASAPGNDLALRGPHAGQLDTARQYEERRIEAYRLSEATKESGCVRLRDLRPGDEITLTISTLWFDEVHDENFWNPDVELPERDPADGELYAITIQGKVEHVADDIRFRVTPQGKIAYDGDESHERPPVTGAVVRVTRDETRTGEDHQLHFSHKDPISEGDEIILFGTDPNRPNEWTYISNDELRQEDPPVIFKGPFVEEMSLRRHGIWTLGLDQVTINGVPMFDPERGAITKDPEPADFDPSAHPELPER
jgi:hypothetical protein